MDYTNGEWLRKKYHDEGLNQKEIAEECGVSQGTISYHMLENDVETKPGGNLNADLNEGKQYADKEWLREQYVTEQKSTPEIAEECGVAATTIQDWLSRHGIERRDQSAAQRPEGKHTNEEWLREQYVEERRSMKDIGDELGMTPSGIKKWIDKFDIPTRNAIEHHRYGPASFLTDENGYESCRAKCNHEQSAVFVHQLVAISEGVNPYKVFSNGRYHIHHENRIPWDNRPENLTLKSAFVHAREHSVGEDRQIPVSYRTEAPVEDLLSDLRNLAADWREIDDDTMEWCADELEAVLREE